MQKTLVRIAFASAALLAASATAQDIQQDRPMQQQGEQQQQTPPQQQPEQPQQAERQQPEQAQQHADRQQQTERQQPEQQRTDRQQQQTQQPPQQQAQQGGSGEPFQGDIDDLAEENDNFRRVLHTGSQVQLVVMSIDPGDEIGAEAHPVEQCLYIVEGTARAVVSGRTSHLTSGGMVCVPNGAEHNVFNTGDEPLKLFTVYSPPEHPADAVHATRADAEQAEQERPA